MSLRLALAEGLTIFIILLTFVYLHVLVLNTTKGQDNSYLYFVTIFFLLLIATQSYGRLVDLLLPKIKKIISKGSYDYRKIISSTRNSLQDCSTVDQLYIITDRIFKENIPVTYYDFLKPENIQKDISLQEFHDKELISYCEQNPHLFLIDETNREITTKMHQLAAMAFIPIMYEEKLIAIGIIGAPLNHSYFRYEDTYIMEWLARELGQTFYRIEKFNKMQDELNRSRKSLSIMEMMNQYHHDIKAPLAIIDGVISTDMYNQEKQKEIVLEQVERGTQLIATMANILRGQHKRSLTSVIVNDLLDECLYIFEARFELITKDFQSNLEIIGDAVDLKILFINLFKNASEASDQRRALELFVRLWKTEKAAIVSIRDTGVGMPTKQINNLWETSSSAKKHGSGIGLQAVKRIADEHNIKIGIQSEENEGTMFILEFPLQTKH